jgi:hypothetical protein
MTYQRPALATLVPPFLKMLLTKANFDMFTSLCYSLSRSVSDKILANGMDKMPDTSGYILSRISRAFGTRSLSFAASITEFGLARLAICFSHKESPEESRFTHLIF